MSRRVPVTALLLALAVAAVAGCGGGHRTAPIRSAGAGAFGWLRPAPPPSGWRRAQLPSGSVLAYPSTWVALRSDAGTRSAALLDRRHRFLAYLNATPRQATESLADWAAFRVAHNREEGDRGVRLLATGHDLPFRGGRGACVRDRYATSTGAQYVELACIVAAGRTTVVVAAAPPAAWAAQRATLERALEAFAA
jgi:hypothetical protein